MQLYDITIAPNTTRQLDAPGSYFYYYTGNAGGADSTITMRGLSSGLRIVLKPGQAFRLPRGESETSWVLTNFSNTATIIGTVIVGDGDITDNRVTGSVEVVDGGKNRSLSGNAFFLPMALGSAPGLFSNVQIWNPANSGKNVIIGQISYSQSAAGSCVYRHTTSALTNSLNGSQSKIYGAGTSSVTVSRSEQNVSMLGTYIFERGMNANQTEIFKPVEPFILKPGNGLVLVPDTANVKVIASAEFFEESI
jgi:hypothetical protein